MQHSIKVYVLIFEYLHSDDMVGNPYFSHGYSLVCATFSYVMTVSKDLIH